MGRVQAVSERVVEAPPDQVYAALADYAATRPKLLTEHFSAYEVRSGGQGAGTQVGWRLQATKSRVRDVLVDVTEPAPGQLVESDANSSMVTTWTVGPSGDGGSAVKVETSWDGAGGVAGFFERTFAPLGLRRIYDGVLANLATEVRA